jgi:hypothetical protein
MFLEQTAKVTPPNSDEMSWEELSYVLFMKKRDLCLTYTGQHIKQDLISNITTTNEVILAHITEQEMEH